MRYIADYGFSCSPRNPRYWSAAADQLFALGCLEQTTAAFERAVELRPTLAYAWNRLGVTRYHQGKSTEAVHAFSRATELTPDNAGGNFHRNTHPGRRPDNKRTRDAMEKTTLFGEVLEAVDQLSLDEQEELSEVLNRRIIEYRRDELARDTQDAQQEFQKGKCSAATATEIMEEILQ